MFRTPRELFALPWVKENHNLLLVNLIATFHSQVRSGPCRVYSNDMRVRVSATGLYTYPDVIAVCGERQFLDDQRDTLLNPTLIVEVLSPSTKAYDRGLKFQLYQTMESFSDYLLVSSDCIHVDRFTRQPGGGWLLTSADHLADAIDLQSIGCRLSLADLYESVDLEK